VTPLEELADEYPAWWVDLLGEHNHVGGAEATSWLLARARIEPGDRMLDCGAFVGAAARMAATAGARAVACDVVADFLGTARSLAGGAAIEGALAVTQRLPFRDGSFASVWALDAPLAPREMSRVAATKATLCLCCEVPADSRGGHEAFLDEWAEYGWSLAAHRPLSLEALQLWRRCEAELVARRPYFEARYGKRAYLGQLDHLGAMVKRYERGEEGHGLFVFARG
jgi:ubiquinone/menaquinone biosynthesis C-methylase UbiE